MALLGISLHSMLEYGTTRHLKWNPNGGSVHPRAVILGVECAKYIDHDGANSLGFFLPTKSLIRSLPCFVALSRGVSVRCLHFGTPHAIGILVSMTQILSSLVQYLSITPGVVGLGKFSHVRRAGRVSGAPSRGFPRWMYGVLWNILTAV